jgi:mevalonate kinase
MAKKSILAGQWESLAAIMNENQAIVDSLGTERNGEDELIAKAREGGALAAKLAGAGGGAIVALTLDAPRTIAALRSAGASTILYPAPGPGLTEEIIM